MLWFKFILCLVFFELVSISRFAIVPDYVNKYMKKENYFFRKIMLESWGCRLYTSAAYTR